MCVTVMTDDRVTKMVLSIIGFVCLSVLQFGYERVQFKHFRSEYWTADNINDLVLWVNTLLLVIMYAASSGWDNTGDDEDRRMLAATGRSGGSGS